MEAKWKNEGQIDFGKNEGKVQRREKTRGCRWGSLRARANPGIVVHQNADGDSPLAGFEPF